jgi:hypothetical protein
MSMIIRQYEFPFKVHAFSAPANHETDGTAKTLRPQSLRAVLCDHQNQGRHPIFRENRVASLVFLGALLWLALGVPGWAQTTAVMETSATTLGVNDQLTLSITISGANANSAGQPDSLPLQGFRIVAGPSVSTQFQWINGQSSSSRTYSYFLLPTQQGDFTLGPFRIATGSGELRTNSVQIKVVAGSSAPPTTPRRNTPWPPSALDEPDTAQTAVADEVFVTTELDRRRAYPGQQINLTYKVYTQLSISGLELKESPVLKGFWVEDIEVPRNPTPVLEEVRGRQYSAFVVKRQALFANAPGKLEIPPSTFALGVRVRSRDPFSFFNFGTTEPVYRRTQPVDVTISPFPESGKPANFRNLAGRFTLSAKVDKTEVKAGDAIALTVVLGGAGNFNTVGDLDFPAMPELKVFSAKSSVKSDRSGDRIEGAKSWEYVIVPQSPGVQTIPGLTVHFFNPDSERYETAATSPLAIKVGRADGVASPGQRIPQLAQRKLTRQGSDINFIKLSGNPNDQMPGLYGNPFFYLVLLLPVAANIGMLAYQKHAEKLAGDISLQRQRKAARRALEALKAAAIELKSGSAATFYSSIGTALTHFISDRYSLPEIDLTSDQIQEKLAERKVQENLIHSTTGLLDRLNFARFAPSQFSIEEARALLEETRNIILELDKTAF